METFIYKMLTGKKSKKSVVDQLYRRPQKDVLGDQTTFSSIVPNYIQFADLVYLPNDQGFIYALVVVDQGSRFVDAIALKDRKVADIIAGFRKIYQRKILKKPKVIVTDHGKEFLGTFDADIQKLGIPTHKLAKVGRHRSVALAERKNQTIGKIIHKILVQTELTTGNASSKWVEHLPLIIKLINKVIVEQNDEREKDKDSNEEEKLVPFTHNPNHKIDLLKSGDKVRVQLDNPMDLQGKPLNGKFRSGDIRFHPDVRTVVDVLIKPNAPLMYMLNGTDNKDLGVELVGYTRNQLLKVSKQENQNEQPVMENETNRFEVQKILDRRKVGRSFEYKIKWKGYRETTYEKRSELMKDIPQMVKKFDEKMDLLKS